MLQARQLRREGFYTSNNIEEQGAFSWFHDPLFNDLPYFENTVGGASGWDKCNMVCPGNCVEYGVTGSAWCFEHGVGKGKLAVSRDKLQGMLVSEEEE